MWQKTWMPEKPEYMNKCNKLCKMQQPIPIPIR